MESEMEKPIYKDWSIVSTIGQGNFAKVYLVERRSSSISERAALKVITLDDNSFSLFEDSHNNNKEDYNTYKQNIINEYLNEVNFLLRLSRGCINIVGCRDYQVQKSEYESKIEILILMDLLTPLKEHFSSGTIREKAIIKKGIDICNALTHLVKFSIIHRDIKPDNLFVDEFGNYVLGDLGLASVQNDINNIIVGTLNYIAPEVYADGRYSHSIDIYGLGLVIFRFLNNGLLPFLDGRKTVTPSAIREAVERRLNGEIPRLEIKNKKLAFCVIKAIHPDIKERYHSAEDFKKDLIIAYRQSQDDKYVQWGSKQHLINENNEKSEPTSIIGSKEIQNIPKVVYQSDSSISSSMRPQKVELDLVSRNSLNEFTKLSDSELGHILETSIFIVCDRAYNGNPVAKSQLLYINTITKNYLPSPIEEYRGMIIKACQLLIENAYFSSSTSENVMNDFIRDILIAQGNVVQDQTRQGRSSSEKSAGEIDIKVTFRDNAPALIEAIKTSSLKSKEIENHIKRLMINYDPIGVYCHFFLIYYFGQSISEFASKLIIWIKTVRINRLSFDDTKLQRHFTNFMEIRLTCTRDDHQEELLVFILGLI